VPSARPVEDRCVPDQAVVIRLELHVDGDSLTGRASDGTRPAREFVGWLGLVAAIDALLTGTASVPPPPASVTDLDEGESS
jgi:hypothetical protein